MLEPVTELTPPSAEELRHALDRRELAVVRHRSEVSHRLGVSDEEMLVLLHIAEHGGLTQTQLTALIGLSRSGMGAMIQRLERAQLVERHPDPSDRRTRLIKLSARSVDRIASAYDALSADVDRLLDEFTHDERDAIGRYLVNLADLSESHARRYMNDPERLPVGASRPDWKRWG